MTVLGWLRKRRASIFFAVMTCSGMDAKMIDVKTRTDVRESTHETTTQLNEDAVSTVHQRFNLVFDRHLGGISSLKHYDDVYDTEYIKHGNLLGTVALTYRQQGKEWVELRLDDSNVNFSIETVSPAGMQVRYELPADLELIKTYAASGNIFP